MRNLRQSKRNRQPAVILGFDQAGEPIVPISRLTRTRWAIICPWCGSEHWHGRGGVDGRAYGERAAHCVVGPHGLGYVAAAPSPELEAAAARQSYRRS
jgi:hypothetical protein